MFGRRRIRPDYDEKIALPEPIEFEEAVQRLLNTPGPIEDGPDVLIPLEDEDS